MLEKLDQIEKRYEEINALLSDPAVLADMDRLRTLGQEQAELQEVVDTYREYQAVAMRLAEAQELAVGDDPELAELASAELPDLEAEDARLQERLKLLLLPTDPNDKRNVIVEIRGGTGGDEAALFAADLFRMYQRYAEAHRWKVDIISASDTGIGGFKEIIFEVKGDGAYSRLKYESGVHRVQRVPDTEAQGRIHTSTATVAVLPEVDEVDVKIDPNDLRIDVYRSSGHGGQSVNTTDSAVRITHLPTGLVVTCQDEKSQLKNKLKAMSVLRARLYAIEEEKRQAELTEARRSQVGTGERAEKIRTYNFPQNRVTDHRINMTVYSLDMVMQGNLDEFIDALGLEDQTARLQAAVA
ncbi:MAG: peptide chain release factor 1 [Anaerolineae bacterium]